jgi:hypothetical protein
MNAKPHPPSTLIPQGGGIGTEKSRKLQIVDNFDIAAVAAKCARDEGTGISVGFSAFQR